MATTFATLWLYYHKVRIDGLKNTQDSLTSTISKLSSDLNALTARVDALEANPETDYSGKVFRSLRHLNL